MIREAATFIVRAYIAQSHQIYRDRVVDFLSECEDEEALSTYLDRYPNEKLVQTIERGIRVATMPLDEMADEVADMTTPEEVREYAVDEASVMFVDDEFAPLFDTVEYHRSNNIYLRQFGDMPMVCPFKVVDGDIILLHRQQEFSLCRGNNLSVIENMLPFGNRETVVHSGKGSYLAAGIRIHPDFVNVSDPFCNQYLIPLTSVDSITNIKYPEFEKVAK